MRKFFLVFLGIVSILISCSDNHDKQDAFLNDPPYKTLTDSIRQFPDSSELYYKRGALLFQGQQPEYAEADLRKAWLLEPREEYALRLANILKDKRPDTAISFLKEATKKLPASIGLQIQLASLYQDKEQWDAALSICNEILKQHPNSLDALALKSKILSAQNKDAEALATLEQAYQLAPGDGELAQQLAFTYAQAKNPKVLALSDSLIKADVEQRHAEPYYFKGLYYENLKKTQEAVQYFDQAIQHDYYFLDAYMDKGQTLYEAKKYTEALSVFQLALKVSASYAEAYYWLGKTQEAMGKKDEAKLNYQRAFSLDTSLKEAKEAAGAL